MAGITTRDRRQKLILTFDAVSKAAEIYINGTLATSHIGMYGEIRADGSRLLKPGKNLITVKVMRKMDGSTSESANAIDFFYSSVRESEQEDAKVKVDNNVFLKEIPHGFYGDEPAGIWQPVKLVSPILQK